MSGYTISIALRSSLQEMQGAFLTKGEKMENQILAAVISALITLTAKIVEIVLEKGVIQRC